MDLILVSLQANKPPTGDAHGKTREDTTENDTDHSGFPTSSRDGDAKPTTCAQDN